ncbi:hypothetical protein ACLB2K_035450 [Fragaria x ananassa]
MAVTFLDESTYHWWVRASRNMYGAQVMTWEQFKTLFLGQYFSQAHRGRINPDFLNMKKRVDENVKEFKQRFTSLSYHVPYLIPDEKTRTEMFIGALSGVYADRMTGVVYLNFLDVVGAAMVIETRRALVLNLEVSTVLVRVHLRRLFHHPLLDLQLVVAIAVDRVLVLKTGLGDVTRGSSEASCLEWGTNLGKSPKPFLFSLSSPLILSFPASKLATVCRRPTSSDRGASPNQSAIALLSSWTGGSLPSAVVREKSRPKAPTAPWCSVAGTSSSGHQSEHSLYGFEGLQPSSLAQEGINPFRFR